ncbi:tetratricopeptide repeat protein [uncultured Dokdonia sp.]|uniref:tetratricopeptide repeat protein n=1 Tax=uncultured Dokdonia sp. TaxID=575653 RepID=UPI00260F48DB|nr:tetratricopeptide repeat protein [uncultured Dokdonia sp.]
MKSITLKFIVIPILFFISTGILRSQEAISTAQWQEDLMFLQKTIHENYPFLFKKIDQTTWDAAVKELYDQIPSLEAHEIKVGLTRMVSLFEYGHTQIPFSTLAKEAVLPINLYHFEDGIFVEGIQKEHQSLLGAKVIKIGGMPILEALKAVRPVVPVENDSYFKAYGLRFLTVPSILHSQGVVATYSKDISLTLEKEGKTFEYTLTAVTLKELSRDYGFTIPTESWVSMRQQDTTPLFLKDLNEKLFFFEYLADTKTMYVRQSSVFNDEKETLQDFYKRLFAAIDANDVEKLVYDVRLNGGGNNYNNKTLIKGIMARPSINKKGSFFYIIGRNTFSACQNLTNEIENYTEAILIGEPTAENKNFYGDARRVTLPNSRINAYLSYAWWQDMPQWENKDWTIPHIAVTMTSKDYIHNEDPVLNAALNYTDTGFILNPTQHLTQLFTEGNMEQFEKDALKIAKDTSYKYADFEKEFGEAGYRIFSQGATDEGLYIMELVTRAYPESSGAWYSLASAQEQVKQLDKATENYKKVLTLDPSSTLASTVKKRLAKLSK